MSSRSRPTDQAPDPYDDVDDVDVRDGRGSHALASAEYLSPRLRRRRAVTLVLLTLLVPGTAQVVAGNRRIGRIALRVWVTVIALLVGAVVLYFVKRSVVLGLVVNSWFLTGLAVALIFGAIGWGLLFLDTLRLARLRLVPGSTRRGVVMLTAGLMALTCGPMVFGATNVFAGRDAVDGIFGGNISAPASKGRYNVLLMGGDSGADRTGTRPDTIMLASIDADTGKTVLFGFARDTENITFNPGSTMAKLMPQGWNCGDNCLLNGLYTWGTEHASQFPAGTKDAGAEATREAVEALSGLDIQYYGLVNLRGFQRFVDAVGGLEIDVKKRTPIGGETSPIKGYIEPGVQRLDGYHALWYARSRAGSSNYDRMARQRCVTTAMVNQLTPQTVILKFKDIASVSGSVVETDIPEGDLGTLGDLALKARGQKMSSVNFVPPLINPWNYDPQVIRSKVAQSIAASAAAPAKAAAPSSASSQRATSGSSATPSAKSSSGKSATGATGATGASENDLDSVCSAS